jgi:UDP-galactopyranose mutase
MARSYSLTSLLLHSAGAALRGLAPAARLIHADRSAQPEHLVVFSQVLWHDVWGRAQEIATRLAERLPVTHLSPTPVHRMLEMRERWQPREEGPPRVRCPLVLPGEYRSGLVRRFNAGHVLREVRRLGVAPERTVLFLNTPFVPALVERIPWGLVVYDWHDDFARFPWAPRGALALEGRTLAHADLFTAGTHFLAQSKRERCGEIHFLQNGVRHEAYAECRVPRPDDLPSDCEAVVGFIGTVGDQLDIDLIESVARALPRFAFVFIGPVRLDRPLRGENIFTLGLRPHPDLPAYVRHFDVGLIPYTTGPGSEAINPTKLLEYAAAGVPTVSTPLPDVVKMFGDCAAIASGAEAFADQIRRAVAGELSDVVARARARAMQTSWESLAQSLWELIETAWTEGVAESSP